MIFVCHAFFAADSPFLLSGAWMLYLEMGFLSSLFLMAMFGGPRKQLWKWLWRANTQAFSTAVISWTHNPLRGYCVTEAAAHIPHPVLILFRADRCGHQSSCYWKIFSAPAEWCTVAKTLILASRMIVTSLMPLIKVSSRHYLGTKIALMSKWHRGRN